jgi:hypothetical protein
MLFKLAPQIGVGYSAGGAASSYGGEAVESTWVRIGGEATVGVVL